MTEDDSNKSSMTAYGREYCIREQKGQQSIMAKRKETVRIYSQEPLARDIFSLTIETSMAEEAHAGQFLGVYTGDASRLLARPISICDADPARGLIRMVYRISGAGTSELSAYQEGQALDVLGVLGNGYDISLTEGKRTVVIGGGIGIPPMLLAAKSIPGEKEIVLGYADAQTFLREEFEREAKVHIATMDGSVGVKGTVIDAMEAGQTEGGVIFACGPMPMLRAVKQYAAEHRMEAYISLEERMACGVGACLGCVCRTVKKDGHTHVNNARICTEGPVFDAGEVEI